MALKCEHVFRSESKVKREKRKTDKREKNYKKILIKTLTQSQKNKLLQSDGVIDLNKGKMSL